MIPTNWDCEVVFDVNDAVSRSAAKSFQALSVKEEQILRIITIAFACAESWPDSAVAHKVEENGPLYVHPQWSCFGLHIAGGRFTIIEALAITTLAEKIEPEDLAAMIDLIGYWATLEVLLGEEE